MTNTITTQEQRIKLAQMAYQQLDRIAGEIHNQYALGSDDWHREIAKKWTPLKEMFSEYVHKHKISKHLYR